ncbi:MAG TPA: MFS transporter [Phenylobacterium sp.]
MNPRVLVLTLSSFAFGSGALIFSGLLEFMAKDLGVSVGAAGQIQTTYVLTAALAGPPLAMLAGRFDRKKVLLTALVATIVLNLICMVTSSYAQLLVFRALIGACAALAGPASSAAVSGLVPPEMRGRALAMVGGGMTIAFVLGIPMGTIIGSIFTWRAAFAMAAGLTAVALVAIAIILPSVKPPPPAMGGRLTFGAAPLFLATFLAFAANMSMNIYIAPVLRVGSDIVGGGVAAFQLMIGVGSFLGLSLGGRAADRGWSGLSITLAYSGLILGATLHWIVLHHYLAPGWPTWILVGLAYVVMATSLFSVMPVIQSRLMNRYPNSAPLALALNGSSASMGQALAASTGGAIVSTIGVQTLPAATITYAFTALVIWRLWEAKR